MQPQLFPTQPATQDTPKAFSPRDHLKNLDKGKKNTEHIALKRCKFIKASVCDLVAFASSTKTEQEQPSQPIRP